MIHVDGYLQLIGFQLVVMKSSCQHLYFPPLIIALTKPSKSPTVFGDEPTDGGLAKK